jgi:hypothetical protein
MGAIDLYKLAKDRIEAEYLAETADARKRRDAKLAHLEPLRPTLERVTTTTPAAVEAGLRQPTLDEMNFHSADVPNTSQRIKEAVMSFGDNEQIRTPDIYNKLLSKYPEMGNSEKALKLRSHIAIQLKKMVDRGQLFLIWRGKGNEPFVYSRTQPNVPDPSVFIEHDRSNFVLRDAIRDQIRSYKGEGFRTRDIVVALRRKYPKQISKDREGSIAASMAKLAERGEVVKTKSGQGHQNIYRAAENGGLMHT